MQEFLLVLLLEVPVTPALVRAVTLQEGGCGSESEPLHAFTSSERRAPSLLRA